MFLGSAGDMPPTVLEGTFPCKWALMESWLLVEQGFLDLPVPPRSAVWPGWFIAPWWILKLCVAPSLWKFG